jgi:hypothetical protein
MGLSIAHNSPGGQGEEAYTATLAVTGTYVNVRTSGSARLGGGRRGSVVGFSRASRKRLMDWYNRIDRVWRARALFITLTYPREFSSDWSDWKRDLDALVKRLRRRWPRSALVWRMELQRRGAPHFHLLVWGIPRVPISWLSRAWYEIVGSGDERHLRAGTQVAGIWNDKKAFFYISKYVAKIGDDVAAAALGRVWGVRGRQYIPAAVVCIRLTRRQFYEVRRVIRAWVARVLRRARMWGRGRGGGITGYLSFSSGMGLILCAADKHSGGAT